jgi:hypothetical protein
METIQQQIGAMQKSIKRQRFAIVALASVIVAGGFIAAVRPTGDANFDTIICKKWVVVDGDGKLRIMAGTTANGYAAVSLRDKDEKLRIVAATVPDGDTSVSWFDKDGKQRIVAGISADGQADVKWCDKDEKTQIMASTFADGTSGLTWFDKDGKSRFGAGILANGTLILPTKDFEPPKKP